jgi:glycosyltransferase involved in cell wall biosynthesis
LGNAGETEMNRNEDSIINTNHTFVVCAYKESPYLEECVSSLVEQSVATNILIATSTPCEYIQKIADRYGLPVYVRDGKSDIRDDWNFAYDLAETDWVTIAHQDDRYDRNYVKAFLKTVQQFEHPICFLTDYIPIKNGKIGPRDVNSKIRRFLRKPLKRKSLAGKRFWKRAVLSLGNTICCPAVTYNKSVLGASFFTSELKFNIDWDTFLKLADTDGAMAYVDKPLTFYRVHDGATSKEFIVNHTRELDDRAMFEKFWPKWMVRIIMLFYKKAYDTYN